MAYSVLDCRNYGIFPNTAVIVQGTSIFTGQVSSNLAVPSQDSRIAGAPIDCRIPSIIPQNCRIAPPF